MKKYDFSSTNSIVKQVILNNTCIHCGEDNQITLDAVALANWRNRELIQNVFPNLNYQQRELIQTGIHPECWNDMFPKEEE
jgi:hypothetical protein